MAVKIGVLTSGGDAQGMNAAVRAVVRSAIKSGAKPYAILEGWQGAVEGGDMIRPMQWDSVGGILNQGGTIIGTARCQAFRTREGLLDAAQHLVEKGIDHLIAIGGDGSLTGTNEFRNEWSSLLAELVESGRIAPELAEKHAHLYVAGLVGSIDNDLVGFDMTIGADSALQRILVAIDQLRSTAASHRRTFVVEVMGRHCGYLPLISAVAGGCDYVFTPEMPPAPGWEQRLAKQLEQGRKAGRRESIVLVAEGATDREGNPITATQVCDALEQETSERPHVTILGHVQRGGTPSAYDRWMPTVLGHAAVKAVLAQKPEDDAVIIGTKHNRVTALKLIDAVADTRAVARYTAEKDYQKAVAARGESFGEMLEINRVISRPPFEIELLNTEENTLVNEDKESKSGGEVEDKPHERPRIAVMHAGGLAPGMNTAVRAAVRLGIASGYEMLGVTGSFAGLAKGRIAPIGWEDVEEWGFKGGAELGTNRKIPTLEEYYAIGKCLEEERISALLVIGGYHAYEAVYQLNKEQNRYPGFRIPMMCVPVSIDNNLPGTEHSVGTDTALNNALWALDKIRESAEASTRCFVAETMGRYCGYLALIAGIAAGAERVYIDEFPMDIQSISDDVKEVKDSFASGRRLCLIVRNEKTGGKYNRDFLARLFEQESEGLFDVRQATLGYIQQGGEPSPYDRILATRLVHRALDELSVQMKNGTYSAQAVGMTKEGMGFIDLQQMPMLVDPEKNRPRHQWWLELGELIPVLCRESIDLEEARD